MKKNDWILVIVLLLLAAGVFIGYRISHREPGAMVVVTVDSAEYARYPLSENLKVVIPGLQGENTLVIQDGAADMTEADCPDQICVRHKKIHYNGETIVCLPHRVVIEITGGENSGLDGVVQ